MSASTPRSRTTRKVLGSLGVLGAAAAVAGLGTFGTFTDSTTPISTEVASGTVDINLANPGYVIPVTTSNFVPGDSMTRAVTLSNDGSSALASVVLGVTATTSSILDTNTTNGLQLTVRSCSQAWTQGGTAQAPTYTCSGTTTERFAGPVIGNRTLTGLNALNPAGVDYLTFSVSLPTAADNTFQGKSSTLNLVFTGTQRAATAR